MLICLEILCVLLLAACSSGIHKEGRCTLNNHLEYLHTESLLQLNLPEDLNIMTSFSASLNDDYTIPVTIDTNIRKIGKELNICPPSVFSMDTLYESCLVNIED